MLEETGLSCGRLGSLMELSGRNSFYEYPNGDQVYLAGIVYLCREFSGELRVQEEEVSRQRFFPIDALPEGLAPGELKEAIFDKVRERLSGD